MNSFNLTNTTICDAKSWQIFMDWPTLFATSTFQSVHKYNYRLDVIGNRRVTVSAKLNKRLPWLSLCICIIPWISNLYTCIQAYCQ